MKRAVEAMIDEEGHVEFLEPVELHAEQRVLVILEDTLRPTSEVTVLSERALAEDWQRPEEEAAWSHLQSGRSS
jgi:hypothetical protein